MLFASCHSFPPHKGEARRILLFVAFVFLTNLQPTTGLLHTTWIFYKPVTPNEVGDMAKRLFENYRITDTAAMQRGGTAKKPGRCGGGNTHFWFGCAEIKNSEERGRIFRLILFCCFFNQGKKLISPCGHEQTGDNRRTLSIHIQTYEVLKTS